MESHLQLNANEKMGIALTFLMQEKALEQSQLETNQEWSDKGKSKQSVSST